MSKIVRNIPDGLEASYELAIVSKSALTMRGVEKLETIKRVAFGIDSLTEGTPTSYIGQLMNRGIPSSAFGMFYVCRTVGLINVNEFTDISGSVSDFPVKMSINGYGVSGTNMSNGSFRYFPNLGGGTPRDWKKARVYYAKQPGGGTFNVSQMGASRGTKTAVNTDGAEELAYVEIDVDYGIDFNYIEITEAVGNVVIFAIQEIMSNDDYLNVNIGVGGKTVEFFSHLEYTTTWMEMLNIDLFIMNGSTNDRFSSDAATLKNNLSTYCGYLSSASQNMSVIIVEPTQTHDYKTTYAKDYKTPMLEVARENKFGYISMQNYLGDFDTVSAEYGMEPDGIHPTATGHAAFGKALASLLGFTKPNEPRNRYGSSLNGTPKPYYIDMDEWEVNFADGTKDVPINIYKFKANGSYIYAYFDITVLARIHPGSPYWKEKTYRIVVQSGSTNDLATIAIINKQAEPSNPGNYTGLDMTLSTSITAGIGYITVTILGYNARLYTKMNNYRITLANSLVTPFTLIEKA